MVLPRVAFLGRASRGKSALAERCCHGTQGRIAGILIGESSASFRRRGFDVMLCTNTLRHYPDLALGVALGIPNRVAYAYKGLSDSSLVRRQFSFPIRTRNTSVKWLRISRVVRPTGPFSRASIPIVRTTRAAGRVSERARSRPTNARVVVMRLTTRQASGNWPRSHLIAALEGLATPERRRSSEVVLTGGPSDSVQLDSAAREFRFRCQCLPRQARVAVWIAFLVRCSAMLTLDSGPRHMGNAAGIPVLFARNLLAFLRARSEESIAQPRSTSRLRSSILSSLKTLQPLVAAGVPPSRTARVPCRDSQTRRTAKVVPLIRFSPANDGCLR